MLNTLHNIVREVCATRDLKTALSVIVRRVRAAMRTDVCSVYLYDDSSHQHILMASEGLAADSVGRVSLSQSQGLVGLVALRKEPLNIDNAAAHPKYCYRKETGEERYHAFLGTPIIHQRQLQGVLVVQEAEQRHFNAGEEAFLAMMSAHLAGTIAHARISGDLAGTTLTHKKGRSSTFSGEAGAPGISIGQAVVLASPASFATVAEQEADDIASERLRFQAALEAVRQQMRRAQNKLKEELSRAELALFDVYLSMLDDNALAAEVEALIDRGQWSQGALKLVIEEHVGHFERMEDPYLRERAADIQDLGRRVLSELQQQSQKAIQWPNRGIIVSEQLTAAMLGEIPRRKLAGLVSIKGSKNSHVAILARAIGVPTIMGVADLSGHRIEGLDLIIDGYQGRVYLSPDLKRLAHYRALIERERTFVTELATMRHRPCVTKDGYRLPLWVNTGLVTDSQRTADRGVEGVGLYRSEVPFMIRKRFLSENEQVDIYRIQLKAFAPRPVTIRTLDIGGDKFLDYFPSREDNPFLGWRGIRITLDHPDIFLIQVRAMLRASEGSDNLRIMLPMISSLAEVEQAQELIGRAFREIVEEGYHVQFPQIGLMIEVPAAVYQIAVLARNVDFLSIGSNDLIQFILAVDRNNPHVSELYQPLHPAVLKAFYQAVQGAHMENTPITLCGEIAGDPAGALLLMAMGFDGLSMSSIQLSHIRWTLRRVTQHQAKEILQQALGMDSAEEIKATIETALGFCDLRTHSPQYANRRQR